jgi:hypothetical protein
MNLPAPAEFPDIVFKLHGAMGGRMRRKDSSAGPAANGAAGVRRQIEQIFPDALRSVRQ